MVDNITFNVEFRYRATFHFRFLNYRHFRKKNEKFAIKTEIEKSPTVGNRLKIYVIAQKPVLSVIKKYAKVS